MTTKSRIGTHTTAHVTQSEARCLAVRSASVNHSIGLTRTGTTERRLTARTHGSCGELARRIVGSAALSRYDAGASRAASSLASDAPLQGGERLRRSAGAPAWLATRRVPASARDFVMPQRHEQYTETEHLVWRTLVRRNLQAVEQYAERLYEPYIAGLKDLGLDQERIPTLEAINAKLAPTGWMAVCVEGYIPAPVYAELIANRIFPMSRNVRHMAHIDFSPTPDLVHDIFGHLPLLFHAPYQRYLQRLAAMTARAEASPWDHALYLANRRMGALKSDPDAPRDLVAAAEAEVDRVQRHLLANPSELTHLARVFLWSIEFGLIGTRDSYRVLGAGLLSSLSECAALYEPGADIRPFSIAVIEKDIHFSDHQAQYYLFESYEQLDFVLDEYQAKMRLRAGSAVAGVM